jgi:hypothetical protein
LDPHGRTIWITDAHRDDGKRFIVRADEKLTAFLELERAVYPPIERTMLTNNRSARCKRYVVRAEEKLTVFLELESATRNR